jgi:predicted lysophospholipase L1 biosynthesis ABC-type transport system permease subunit
VNQQFNLFDAILVIAVLRTLGSSRRQVRSAMVDESLLITLSGAAAGIAFGAVIGSSGSRGWDRSCPVSRSTSRLDPVQALGYE